jgi:XTP/dITP diphosphohydrolase
MTDTLTAFQRLEEIVAELRQKCPWDREQTKESIRHLTIEETYELAEAILKDDYEEIKVELGDLLLHVLFYTRMAEEKQQFTLHEVITSLTEKLIRRHPHVYGPEAADDPSQVAINWELIKAKENKGKKKKKLTLDGVPEHLPSLIKALRMQEKAANVGFDWENPKQVWEKVKEEILEFEKAEGKEEREAEMGDLLFSLVNYCRFIDINPEDALARTNQKFKQRFEFVETSAQQEGKTLQELSLPEMEALWQQAKRVDLA